MRFQHSVMACRIERLRHRKTSSGDHCMTLLRPRLLRLVLSTGLAFATAGVLAQAPAPIPIKVSYQVSYWALPFFVAQEKGWWAEAGLKPELVAYPAGAQQIAGAPSKSWDVG